MLENIDYTPLLEVVNVELPKGIHTSKVTLGGKRYQHKVTLNKVLCEGIKTIDNPSSDYLQLLMKPLKTYLVGEIKKNHNSEDTCIVYLPKETEDLMGTVSNGIYLFLENGVFTAEVNYEIVDIFEDVKVNNVN